MSSQLRITRSVLRIAQTYLSLLFSLLLMIPGPIGRKLFRLGANLVDILAWPIHFSNVNSRLVTVHKEIIGGLDCTWFLPQTTKHPNKVIIYIHGGGFMMCSAKTHAPIATAFAANLHCRVLFINYALAPEKQYPHALDQIIKVYRDLLTRNVPHQNIVIGGDSAGGGLTLAALLRLRDESRPLPVAAFLDSPLLDLGCRGDSLIANSAFECVLPSKGSFTATLFRKTFANYVGSASATHPYVSPLFGDFRNLPPLHISYSEHEVLRDDARRLVEKAQSHGADVKAYPLEWAPHASLVFHKHFPEGQALYREVEAFIKLHLSLF